MEMAGILSVEGSDISPLLIYWKPQKISSKNLDAWEERKKGRCGKKILAHARETFWFLKSVVTD